MEHRGQGLIALAAIALGAASFGMGQARADILVGLQAPITGASASAGEQMRQGFARAVSDINAAGGVLGQKIVPVVADDACNPRQAVVAATALATKGAVFVDGGFCSGASIPASSVYADADIIMMSPASTSPVLTEDAFRKGWNNVYRVCGRDDQQGKVAGAYIVRHFAGEPIAIVDDGQTYGKGLADETRWALKQAGIEEAVDAEVNAGATHFSALISTLKTANTTLVYFGGYGAEAGPLVREAHDRGLNAVFMLGDASSDGAFWQLAGSSGNGTLFTFNPDPLLNPAARGVIAEFQKSGFKPDGYTLYSYAVVQIFQQAATKVGSVTEADLAKALHGNTFHTVIGPITFDREGDPTGRSGYVLWQWENGNLHML